MIKLLSILFILVFINVSSWAGNRQCEQLWNHNYIKSDQLKVLPSSEHGSGFILPNEKNLENIRSNLALVTEGLYVTVGTERGFMSAALTGDKTKALVLVDRDDKVVLYNLINKSLLALAKNREDYLKLRQTVTYTDLQTYIKIHGRYLSRENQQTLTHPQIWSWWIQNVQQNIQWHSFHQDPQLNADKSYANTNYLFDNKLFDSISELAKNNQIYVFHENLNSPEFLQKLTFISRTLHQNISVFDMSNSWQEGYLGHQQTITIINSLQSLMRPKSQIILTYQSTDNVSTQNFSQFKYSMFTISSLNTMNDLNHILGNLTRIEPSRPTPNRARMQRFGYDD